MIEYDALFGDGAGNYLGLSILANTPLTVAQILSLANFAGGQECN